MRHLLILALVLVCAPLCAGEAVTITLVNEDSAVFPWVAPDGGGLDQELARQAATQVGATLVLKRMPWKKCLLAMQENQVDGALCASFKEERLAMGVYPGEGQPDPGLRFHTDTYALYRVKGGTLDWDGGAFRNLSGTIAIQPGFSVGEIVRKAGAQVDETAKDQAGILRKLVAGSVQGAALHALGADILLAKEPQIAAQVEKCATPLATKPYYTMLSKDFVAKHPDTAKAFWAAAAKIRDSEAFKTAVAERLAAGM